MLRNFNVAGPNKPEFTTITVAGVGLIGGSLALALRRAGYRGKVLGVSSPESLQKAKRLGAIDEGFPYERLADAAERSDLIVLATPISRIIEHLAVLGQAGARLRPGTVVTDVGSTKAQVLETAVRCLPGAVHFVGGHPMAGSEERGVAAADPLLFQNAYYVLTPAPGVPEEVVQRLAAFLGLTGARLLVLDAARHDRIAAAISHLPQLLAVHLVNFLDSLGDDREHGVHLAAGGFRDMTRIASSPFEVWRDIVSTNRAEIAKALDAFAAALGRAGAELDEGRLQQAFERAGKTRAGIPRDTKGFLSRLWDVLVVVDDRPGMIADIAGRLAAKGINIKDIEVLKVREGETGSMRLAFAAHELALEAIEELKRGGYAARMRS
jgi:prephenate dehydrogenase